MTADLWDALAQTNDQVTRLINVIDGPPYTRVDGSKSRHHDEGLLAIVASLTGSVEALTEATKQPTKIHVPAWAVTLIVATIGAIATIGVALIEAIGRLR